MRGIDCVWSLQEKPENNFVVAQASIRTNAFAICQTRKEMQAPIVFCIKFSPAHKTERGRGQTHQLRNFIFMRRVEDNGCKLQCSDWRSLPILRFQRSVCHPFQIVSEISSKRRVLVVLITDLTEMFACRSCELVKWLRIHCASPLFDCLAQADLRWVSQYILNGMKHDWQPRFNSEPNVRSGSKPDIVIGSFNVCCWGKSGRSGRWFGRISN